ncbi:SpoIIE family protein phosphatase [Actinoplanes rectilineatus]|uniref:SpoIIE family protein phosphatase n=1 Tax=Actinoplanes rectilineatus TaxID=113571 RepID=UPI0005F2DA33|nr:SpoIIE family protein phosphatase [Actinoplanes rectilineatus]
MGGQVYAQATSELWSTAGSEPGRIVVARAVGLLAGRARCRLADAHRHLMRMASAQHRDVGEVAGRVIRLLDSAGAVDDRPGPETVQRLVAVALAGPGTAVPEPAPATGPTPWLSIVQGVLDALPGMAGYLTPVRGPDGTGLTDLVWAAVSPDAISPDGRCGAELLGLPVSRHYPDVLTADRWQTYQRVLETGEPADIGPLHLGDAEFTVRARALGPGLLLSWDRRDATDRSRVERLANLGWGEWNLVSGEISWSPQMYRIYDRDPGLGPLSLDDGHALTVVEDRPQLLSALEFLHRGRRADVVTRIRSGDRVKHLRIVCEAVRDGEGRTLRLYGIIQDVTEQQAGAERLAEVERDLAAEHELAARLQRIILPVPTEAIDLPGLSAAVRYLPAGDDTALGGDWYQAIPLPDDSVLLAVGDVAGHGTQAATTMAQLRHALRALAVVTSDPGALLGHLNRLTCDLERDNPELAATAVIARFDPIRGELTWAQAGHPPPLVSRSGRTAPLHRPPGPMLGVLDDAAYTSAVTPFGGDDVLLLYTDGLVESRRWGWDAGLDSVITMMDAAGSAPEQPLTDLLGRLRRANPDDDACILAVRPSMADARLAGLTPCPSAASFR